MGREMQRCNNGRMLITNRSTASSQQPRYQRNCQPSTSIFIGGIFCFQSIRVHHWRPITQVFPLSAVSLIYTRFHQITPISIITLVISANTNTPMQVLDHANHLVGTTFFQRLSVPFFLCILPFYLLSSCFLLPQEMSIATYLFIIVVAMISGLKQNDFEDVVFIDRNKIFHVYCFI